MSMGADCEDEALQASNFDDSEKSDFFSDDEYSTISVNDDPDPPDDDNEGADPLETVACAQSRVGELPEGADLGVFIDGSPDANAFEGRADFSCPADNPRSIPKGRSIAHHSITDGKAVFLSFDIEIAGDLAGIIQISGEIFRMKLSGGGVGKDRIEEVMRSANVFNHTFARGPTFGISGVLMYTRSHRTIQGLCLLQESRLSGGNSIRGSTVRSIRQRRLFWWLGTENPVISNGYGNLRKPQDHAAFSLHRSSSS